MFRFCIPLSLRSSSSSHLIELSSNCLTPSSSDRFIESSIALTVPVSAFWNVPFFVLLIYPRKLSTNPSSSLKPTSIIILNLLANSPPCEIALSIDFLRVLYILIISRCLLNISIDLSSLAFLLSAKSSSKFSSMNFFSASRYFRLSTLLLSPSISFLCFSHCASFSL